MISNKPMPKQIETKTEVKISTPIAQRISQGIMMLGAFSALVVLAVGLTLERPWPKSHSTSFVCPGVHCYYLSPNGNDNNNGLGIHSAWQTLGRADNTLRAGDYLYIMGGTYPSFSMFWANSDHGGTSATNKVTINAYGDSPAIFSVPKSGYDASAFYILPGADWFTIDGLYNGQRYLIFRGMPNQDTTFIGMSEADHVTVRGVEWDGSPINKLSICCQGIGVQNSDYLTLEDNYIHDLFLPTAFTPVDPENGQGQPGCIYVSSVRFFTIRNNIVKNCNYAGISIERAPGAMEYGGWYGKVINNFVDARWGGGIHLNGVDYSLVEGNVVTHAGETTSHAKPTMLLAGNNNSLRNNIIYGPSGMGTMNAWGLQIDNEDFLVTDNNLIYNNVMFGNNNGSGAIFYFFPGEEIRRMNSNIFANNIVYHNSCEKQSELCDYNFDLQFDWGPVSYDPTTHEFLGNKFYNNLIRDESTASEDTGMNNNQTIFMHKLGGNVQTWSLSRIQTDYPNIWQNNIGGDPLLVSEDPDHYSNGLNGGWWQIKKGSPAINAGRVIHDTNGKEVETLYPGYGWSDLPYNGKSPDIGAYETSYDISVPVD